MLWTQEAQPIKLKKTVTTVATNIVVDKSTDIAKPRDEERDTLTRAALSNQSDCKISRPRYVKLMSLKSKHYGNFLST